jgi:6-phosphofructokinase
MNSVISAAAIEARNSGWDVLGIMDGFEHLIDGRTEEARPLVFDSPFGRPGPRTRTSGRFGPTPPPENTAWA